MIVDLEDGVSPDLKDDARMALGLFAQDDFGGTAAKTGVRVNGFDTAAGISDLAAMLDWPSWPGMIVVPKVESAFQVQMIREIARSCGHDPRILATFETARGIECAAEILGQAGPGVVAGYGSADHTAQTGGAMSPAGLAWARGRIVNAAALAGVRAVDGACLDITDPALAKQDAMLAREMGFAGKIAIHPRQVPEINAAFAPTSEEVTHAQAIIDAFESASGGVCVVDGRMVDRPVVERAHQTVAAARTISS